MQQNNSEGIEDEGQDSDVVSDNEDIVQNEDHESSDAEDVTDDDQSEGVEAAGDGDVTEENRKAVRMGDGELDMSVYTLFRTMKLNWPCLTVDAFSSFDKKQTQSPYSVTFVAGSQAERANHNRLYLFKCRTFDKKKSDCENVNVDDDDDESSSESEEEEDSSDEDESKKPELKDIDKLDAKKTGSTTRQNTMHCIGFKHDGVCNRVRQWQLDESNFVVASWSSKALISIYNVTSALESLDASKSSYETSGSAASQLYPGHKVEGYGLAWSPVKRNQIASGDCKGNLHVWEVSDEGSKVSNIHHLQGCKSSIEDIQWSPSEATVLSSCSVDGSLRVWDTRTLTRSMINVEKAHTSDVNVISWNNQGEPFIISGGDDNNIKVWDLRQMLCSKGRCTPVAQFDFHKRPITSVQWNPCESTQFAASSEDNTVSIWDLSLERENVGDNENNEEVLEGSETKIPAQLLFLHEGQQNSIKEVTWHSSVKNLILSTASDGFHLFMPNNL